MLILSGKQNLLKQKSHQISSRRNGRNENSLSGYFRHRYCAGRQHHDYAIFEVLMARPPSTQEKTASIQARPFISAEMMLRRHMGWTEAEDLIGRSMEAAIGDKVVTYDVAHLMEGATEVKCSAFRQAMIARMQA